jgi:hypothetical protein
MIDQKQSDNVGCFNYIGSIVISDVRCTREIKSGISLARATFKKKKTLSTSKLELNLKKKLVKCYVWSASFMVRKFGHFGK